MSTSKSFNDKTWTQWVGLAFRLIIGGLFIYAAYTKLIDLDAAKRAVVAYKIFPIPVAQTIGVILPVVEVALGALLVVGLFTRWAALGIGALLVVYIVGISSAWARGLSIDCGCFSPGGPIDLTSAIRGYKRDIVRDTIMGLLALWLVLWPRTALSVDRWLKGPATPSELVSEPDAAV